MRYDDQWRKQYDKTRPLTNAWMHNEEWKLVWRRALRNMPYKMQQAWRYGHYARIKGTTPIPEYAEGIAKGKLRMDGSGIIWEITKHPEGEPKPIGRPSALGLLLGYICQAKCRDRNGRPYRRPRVDTCGLDHKIRNGWRPRDPAKRALLLQLADYEGNALAYKMMTAKGLADKYLWGPNQ